MRNKHGNPSLCQGEMCHTRVIATPIYIDAQRAHGSHRRHLRDPIKSESSLETIDLKTASDMWSIHQLDWFVGGEGGGSNIGYYAVDTINRHQNNQKKLHCISLIKWNIPNLDCLVVEWWLVGEIGSIRLLRSGRTPRLDTRLTNL